MGISDVILLFLGGLIGVMFDRGFKVLGSKKKLRSIKKRLKAIKIMEEDDLHVESLINAVPHFEKKDLRVAKINKSLFVGFPEEMKELLNETNNLKGSEITFQEDCSFNKSSDFNDIAERANIPDLPRLIDKHRKIIAEQVIKRSDGFYFNGQKFGLYSINNPFNRSGKDEDATLDLDLYETDYFTKKVFHSIYQELKGKGHPIGETGISELSKYNMFTNSIGINALVVVDSGKGKEMVLSQRSKHAAYHKNRQKMHVSINEGLSQTDYDSYSKQIRLDLCVRRGLEEELGLDGYELDKLNADIKFHDLFLERENFEIGLTCSVDLDGTFEEHIKGRVAKDKVLEIEKLEAIPFIEKELNTYVANNDFIPHGLYTLKMIGARRGITVYKA